MMAACMIQYIDSSTGDGKRHLFVDMLVEMVRWLSQVAM